MKKVKLSFADDMVLYIENPKDLIRKVLEVIKEFITISGYKINIQKWCFYTLTIFEKNNKNYPFTTALKIKYLVKV